MRPGPQIGDCRRQPDHAPSAAALRRTQSVSGPPTASCAVSCDPVSRGCASFLSSFTEFREVGRPIAEYRSVHKAKHRYVATSRLWGQLKFGERFHSRQPDTLEKLSPHPVQSYRNCVGSVVDRCGSGPDVRQQLGFVQNQYLSRCGASEAGHAASITIRQPSLARRRPSLACSPR
jgi:hypothetical protein